MATNCPQHVKPRACRSAYVRFTSAWNSVRGNRLRSWLNMLENRVTGEPPWWWRVEACRPRHHHTPRRLTRSQTLIWTRVTWIIESTGKSRASGGCHPLYRQLQAGSPAALRRLSKSSECDGSRAQQSVRQIVAFDDTSKRFPAPEVTSHPEDPWKGFRRHPLSQHLTGGRSEDSGTRGSHQTLYDARLLADLPHTRSVHVQPGSLYTSYTLLPLHACLQASSTVVATLQLDGNGDHTR